MADPETPAVETADHSIWSGGTLEIPSHHDAERDNLLQALKELRDARAVIGEKEKYISQLQRSIKELAKQLKGVAQFIDMREDIEERLEKMEKDHVAEVAKYRGDAQDARLEMLETRVQLRSEGEMLKKNHDRDVTVKATQLLDKRTREVNNQNFSLVKDKLLMSKEMESSRQKSEALESENTALRRKAQLSEGAEAELLQRSVAQKKQIGALKKQVKHAEDAVDAVVKEYEDELKKKEKAYTKQVNALTAERDNARHDALVLRTELKRLREASSRVAEMHSDLQTFFHEALRDVRFEVFEERRRAIVGVPCSSGTNASHTASSALRLETQPRLMITDVFGTSSRSRGEWSIDKKGFPLLIKKEGAPKLPPIPPPGDLGSPDFLQCVRELQGVPPVPSSSAGPHSGEDEEEEEDVVLDEGDAALRHPYSIPSAPTLKQLQEIDIRQLNWGEKERVIRYLFKRLQQAAPAGPQKGGQPLSTQDAAELSRGSDTTFLTQH